MPKLYVKNNAAMKKYADIVTRSSLFLFFILCIGIRVDSLELKRVLVLSRHNIRTPLTENLQEFTPRELPKWSERPGHLTKKGALVEGYMGEYFFQWLNREGLLPDGCPDETSVYIYANTKDRTKESAKAFANSAFRYCNVSVHHLNTTSMDPIFNPIIRNSTVSYKKMVTEKMQAKLDDLQLAEAYLELNRIVDIKNSYICNAESYCDLAKDNTDVVYEVGEEPNVKGPLTIANSFADLFIMSYYDGKPLEGIAWGEITRPEQWELFTNIAKQNQDVRFNLTSVSKDFASPLLKYISNIFLSNNETPKFTLLMGHDSNLNSVISGLDFKPFVLPNQYESYPIGGKLVFQKWSDGKLEYLKMEYVYQTWSKLRDGAKISLDDPPQRVVLEVNGCETNENGFCPWDDFVKIMGKL